MTNSRNWNTLLKEHFFKNIFIAIKNNFYCLALLLINFESFYNLGKK